MEDRLLVLLPQLNSAGPERNAAELTLTQHLLPERPGDVLKALVEIASRREALEALRVQSLILLRRFAFRPLTPLEPTGGHPTYSPKEAWDELSIPAQADILSSLLTLFVAVGEPGRMKEAERHAVSGVVGEVGRQCLMRGHPWQELPQALLQSVSQPAFAIREAAYLIYSCAPKTLDDPFASSSQVIAFLSRGLADSESPSVRIAALSAACAWIRSDEPRGEADIAEVVKAMLGVLPPLVNERKEERLYKAMEWLVDMASCPKGANACVPVLGELVNFIVGLVRPKEEDGGFDEGVRQAGIELLTATAENAGAAILASPDGGKAFLTQVLRLFLGMMTEVEDEEAWYKVERTNSSEDDAEIYVIAEQALDRLAQALGSGSEHAGQILAGLLFGMLRPMAGSQRWEERHAALSAVAAVAEGLKETLMDETASVSAIVGPAMADPHPRVRYAAVYAIAQLCTDLEGVYQEHHGSATLRQLTTLMSNPHEQPRLQAFAAASLINYCDDATPESLQPHLTPLFKGLIIMLKGGRRFVQEAAVRAMAGVLEGAANVAAEYYTTIMPLLFNILETPLDVQYRGLIAKSMDCAAVLASAVPRDAFAPDADRLAKTFMNAHSSIVGDADPVADSTITAMTYICTAMPPERYVPYLDFILPLLLQGANIKPDVSISGALDSEHEYDEEWETLDIGGQTLGIRTSALEEKASAVDMLSILCEAMGSSLMPHYPTIIDTVLPLLKFYFSEDVRDAASSILPALLKGSIGAHLPADQLVHVLNTFSRSILDALVAEANLAFVATLLTTWSQCFEQLPNALEQEQVGQLLSIAESLLQQIAVREKVRQNLNSGLHVSADDELDLEEAQEDDGAALRGLGRALRDVIVLQKERFNLQPFRTHLDTWIRNDPSVSTPARRWALSVAAALIESWGPASASVVGPFAGDIVSGISSRNLEIRFPSACVVGVCAQYAGASYVEVINASIPLLIAGFARGNGSDGAKLARENCVSAVAKIIRNPVDGVSIDVEAVLPRWVDALPVEKDTEEIEPTYALLLELIARGHPTIAPTTPSVAAHITSALAAPLGKRGTPEASRQPLATGLRRYLDTIPQEGGLKQQMYNSLSEIAQRAVRDYSS